MNIPLDEPALEKPPWGRSVNEKLHQFLSSTIWSQYVWIFWPFAYVIYDHFFTVIIVFYLSSILAPIICFELWIWYQIVVCSCEGGSLTTQYMNFLCLMQIQARPVLKWNWASFPRTVPLFVFSFSLTFVFVLLSLSCLYFIWYLYFERKVSMISW